MDALAQLNASLTGRYAIERRIGAGGMAAVYLARDVRHDRRVAVKVLDPELGAVLGGERFLAEIKVTATLQHPNLLPLFDSGEADGLLFYVMPYVEGESLRHRLGREKQLSVEEALRMATAMAGALDYAHRHGVIHRDLKPENILLHENQPLIADFGIALAVSNAGGARITQTGISLGTPQYMSPEQATGDRVVDGRTDIYSLAAVLYEMLTGDPPHLGSTAQAIIAKLLTERPRNVRLSRATVPEHVAAAIDRALEKLPADRFATAHEFSEALRGRLPTGSTAIEVDVQRDAARPAHSNRLVVPMLAATAIVAGALAVWGWLRPSPATPVASSARFVVTLPPNITVDNVYGPLTISHDGRSIVFRGTVDGAIQLVRRRVDEIEAKPIPHSENAGWPSLSPDDKWVGYIAGTSLRKVPIDGGPSALITTVNGSGSGFAWAPSGTLVISERTEYRGLSVVSSSGGKMTPLTVVDTTNGEESHRWPRILGDGNTILYTSWPKTGIADARIAVTTLAGGKTDARVLDIMGSFPLGVAAGHLLYVSAEGVLMAVAFDVPSRAVSGAPIALMEGIEVNRVVGSARVALSDGGTLVYLSSATRSRLVTSTLSGLVERTVPQIAMFAAPAWSPDGRRIAVRMTSTEGSDLWLYDVSSSALTRLTTDGHSDVPSWSPDGKRIVYASTRGGRSAVWSQAVDGGGPAEKLFAPIVGSAIEASIAPDGHTVLFRSIPHNIIETIDIAGDKKAKPLFEISASSVHPMLSPDGKWLAYASDESGTPQVAVRSFPGAAGPTQISTDGGTEPVWSPDGSQLYYRRGRQVIAATLAKGATITVTGRRVLFEQPTAAQGLGGIHQNMSVSPDGKRFAWLKGIDEESRLIVTTNWFNELRAAIETKR